MRESKDPKFITVKVLWPKTVQTSFQHYPSKEKSGSTHKMDTSLYKKHSSKVISNFITQGSYGSYMARHKKIENKDEKKAQKHRNEWSACDYTEIPSKTTV